MKFNEMNIYEIMFFRIYTVNKKHDMIKIGNQTRVYHKCSNNFAVDCIL